MAVQYLVQRLSTSRDIARNYYCLGELYVGVKKTIGFPYTLLGFFCIIISCSHLRLRTITFVTQQYSAGGYIIYLLLISLKYKI